MPLREDLLNPIPGPNPCGENLRYAPVYDKIKEARREDDDAPQGEWRHERKTADYVQVIKLSGDALAAKSKDLQIAVWLTEALLKKEGFSGLRAGLGLIQKLIEDFWDGLYPELEDGDAELRAVPLEWLGGCLDQALRRAPITRNGINWFKYKESRTVGYEADADNEAKAEARAAAIADGKLTGEEWDAAFAASSKAFYVALEADLDGILELLESLGSLCEEKFGDANPSFSPLRATTEEVRHTVHGLLQKKREIEPDEPVAAADDGWSTTEEEVTEEEAAPVAEAAPVRPKAKKGSLSVEPADKEDACQRIVAVARYLRREDPYSPAPYLLLRGLRWGELRAAGASVDAGILEAPPTEIRQSLKRLALEYEWQQVLDLAETAVGLPCGRGWLDVQRYAARAATELGYEQIATAIRGEVIALLAAYPDLPDATLLDDTPTANPETKAWLQEIAPAPVSAEPAPPAYVPEAEMETDRGGEGGTAADRPPDAYDLAREAVRSGHPDQAIDILTREVAVERSGRGRFQRRLQLAELCLAAGHERIAQPILEQLAAEIDRRGLEDWESPSMIAHPLALLYRCLDRSGASDEVKQATYDRICRLDPMQALSCGR
jgi:type VI secretion system protein ImpA